MALSWLLALGSTDKRQFSRIDHKNGKRGWFTLLTTLEERRARGDMVETFKTLNGKNRVKVSEWFEVQEEEARPTRLNTLMVAGDAIKKKGVLVGQKANRELRRNFFTVRVVNEWNSLPEEVKAVKSTNAFKNAYDRWFTDKKNKERDHEPCAVKTRITGDLVI